MALYLLLIAAVCLYHIRCFRRGTWNETYLQREDTDSIRGIFLLFVFGVHYLQYVNPDSLWDRPLSWVCAAMGQGVVVMFLFYSGYGVAEAIRERGENYIKAMPVRRIWPTVSHYWVAVGVFWIADLCIGRGYSAGRILLAFVGWESIGNSNWYIFAIFWCYLITWLVFRFGQSSPFRKVTLVTLLLIGYVLILHRARPGQMWWYNTVPVYPAGMWYSLYRSRAERFLSPEQGRRYLVVLMVMAAAAMGLRPFTHSLPVYIVWALLFAGTILLITMRVSIKNVVLTWLGRHTFEFYIFQRLPMMVLRSCGMNRSSPYLFGLLSLSLSLLIAALFYRLFRSQK